MKRDDGVTPIIGTAEQLGQLGLRHLLGDAATLPAASPSASSLFLVFGDVEKKPRLFKIGLVFFPTGENAL